MPCVNADGTLTPVAERVLRSMHAPGATRTPDEVAREAAVPLYRARASLRELDSAGFVALDGSAYRLTPAGAAKLDAPVPAGR